MKKLFLTLVTALVVAGTAHAKPVIGQPAPEFTATDTKGVSHSLSDFRGKTVVLEWTNHDCPYVKKHYDTGNMQALQREATAEGVVWLTIISSAPGKQGYVTAEEADALTAERDAAPTAVL
ncbi:MAG: redoxin domain-containing protein, partial [Gammaproteobacteria bacterium]